MGSHPVGGDLRSRGGLLGHPRAAQYRFERVAGYVGFQGLGPAFFSAIRGLGGLKFPSAKEMVGANPPSGEFRSRSERRFVPVHDRDGLAFP